ncbi:MAG: fumarylacetoacetate hydrolase family protein [Gemmataceae bacterium]|nr:fumarylacetoacetate hydrolase family protein [Gemmata sp.]MDW8197546.1 fumarylacetoacetate hydrolase family protein [Gemmataceae bacterium]
MQLGQVRLSSGAVVVMALDRGNLYPLDMNRDPQIRSLADVLHQPDPVATAQKLISREPVLRATDCEFLAPINDQEIWAAGVTYKRSKVAREEESQGAAQFYDKVYTAPRPELFFKATAQRVVHPGQPVRIRADARWSVPEPELTLVISPRGQIVGYTIGNDMSSRDIEGENPLYLPQAKVYKGSCAIGPVITPVAHMPPLGEVEIRLVVRRAQQTAFEGRTTLTQMARTPQSLVEWLLRDNEFPHGALLLTGTGIVPPDEFTLQPGDLVSISITGIGTLTNPVA